MFLLLGPCGQCPEHFCTAVCVDVCCHFRVRTWEQSRWVPRWLRVHFLRSHQTLPGRLPILHPPPCVPCALPTASPPPVPDEHGGGATLTSPGGGEDALLPRLWEWRRPQGPPIRPAGQRVGGWLGSGVAATAQKAGPHPRREVQRESGLTFSFTFFINFCGPFLHRIKLQVNQTHPFPSVKILQRQVA